MFTVAAQTFSAAVQSLEPSRHTYYGSGNLPGSANQGVLGILFLNPTLQESLEP